MVTIVGEVNPYGGDPHFALYPAPANSAGYRLCCLILGMRRRTYIDVCRRVNLCTGKWSLPAARGAAEAILQVEPGKLILLGAKVCQAFRLAFRPFETYLDRTVLVLPHPSGRNLIWNEKGVLARARAAVAAHAPELVPHIGKGDGE